MDKHSYDELNKSIFISKKIIFTASIIAIFTILILFFYPIKEPIKQNTPSSNIPSKNKTIPQVKTIEKKVCKGDSLVSILKEYLPISEIIYLSKKSKNIFPLDKLVQDRTYRLSLKNNIFYSFEYEIDDFEKLVVIKKGNEFFIKKSNIHYDIKPTIISGTINSSLFESINSCGEKDSLAFMLSDIFAWDIDFIRDIRIGDSFKVIVEKRYRKGKFKGYGKILAARFINQGKVFNGFLYTTKTGRMDYFDENGLPLRKTFLKAPLRFTRISSKFSYHRFHPILKVIRPHLGIDYAAPKGTPIKSVADGIVIKKAYDRAAGRYVKIRHPNGYVTVYNHMCRFARGLKRGKRVSQGEIIGYVGTTGYATGPHLDFRVKYHGRYINPLKIKSTPLSPLPKEELSKFKAQIAPLISALNRDDVNLLALNSRPKILKKTRAN